MAMGDHLYVPGRKPGVFHCGIDSGEGTVIHVWGHTPSDAVVSEVCFADFAQGHKLSRVDYLIACYQPKEVVRRARSCIGKPFNYTLGESNCEHFATWCKTNIWVSSQAEKVKSKIKETLKVVGTAIVCGIVIADIANAQENQKSTDPGKRSGKFKKPAITKRRQR